MCERLESLRVEYAWKSRNIVCNGNSYSYKMARAVSNFANIGCWDGSADLMDSRNRLAAGRKQLVNKPIIIILWTEGGNFSSRWEKNSEETS